MSAKYSTGIRSRPNSSTLSVPPPKRTKFQQGGGKSSLNRGRENVIKECNKPSTGTESRFLLTTIHSSEKGWGSKTDHQPKQYCKTSTFQDGKHHNVERHPKTRGLYDKSRLQRCLLQKTTTSNKIQLGRENLSIQLPSFRVVVGPLGLYQDHS